MNFTFNSKNGLCPSCKEFGRIWYIQDRYISSGNYEYCLMSREEQAKPIQKFKDISKVAQWLNNDESNAVYDKAVAEYIINRSTINACSEVALIEKNNVEYRLNKTQCTIQEISQPRKETGWHDSYMECLKAAKEILQKLHVKQYGEQISFVS